MSELIPPGERRELRAVVRQQIKVLRAEVKQRKSELVAEAEARLMERYRDEDKKANDLMWRICQLTDDVNRQLEDLMKEYEVGEDGGNWRRGYGSAFQPPTVYRVTEDRKQLHKALLAGIDVQVEQAQLNLDRQEADLLRSLAMEALETEQARAFLGRIPTVAELVPSKRLNEIERQFDQSKS